MSDPLLNELTERVATRTSALRRLKDEVYALPKDAPTPLHTLGAYETEWEAFVELAEAISKTADRYPQLQQPFDEARNIFNLLIRRLQRHE